MTAEEEIARAIGGVLFNVSNFPEKAQSRLLGQDMKPLSDKLTAALSPLLNRVRAEALREAAVKAQEAFVDEQGGIGYARVRTDWLHAEASRIEQNSEGKTK